jgi:hypothetical protein
LQVLKSRAIAYQRLFDIVAQRACWRTGPTVGTPKQPLLQHAQYADARETGSKTENFVLRWRANLLTAMLPILDKILIYANSSRERTHDEGNPTIVHPSLAERQNSRQIPLPEGKRRAGNQIFMTQQGKKIH